MTTLHDPSHRSFASDNYAGVHPEVLAALARANGGHQVAYGADTYTEALAQVMRRHFGEAAQTYPVFNGTGANVVALTSMMPRWGAVVCAAGAHINVDENGAPERVGGMKLLPVEAPGGKLTPELVTSQAHGFGDEHRAQPAVVAVTQSTELGTVYTPAELAALADQAHGLGMRLYLDGARLANAAVHLGLPFAAFTTDVGVDVLGLGGTKNGLMGAEAVVVLDPTASDGMTYLRKAGMQLASKMRFASAQLLAMYDGDLWSEAAGTANAMARRLRAGVEGLPGVRVTQPTEANAVFATLPAAAARRVREEFAFYDWDTRTGEVRWMCSFDTTADDVDRFVAAVARAVGATGGSARP